MKSLRLTALATAATLALAGTLASHSVLAADRVKVGFISTLSGPNAALGIDIRDAFNLAVKMNGGKLGGLPAEVTVLDDQLNPDTGKQLADRLVREGVPCAPIQDVAAALADPHTRHRG